MNSTIITATTTAKNQETPENPKPCYVSPKLVLLGLESTSGDFPTDTITGAGVPDQGAS